MIWCACGDVPVCRTRSVRSPSAPETSMGWTATLPDPKLALSSQRPVGCTDRWAGAAPPVDRLPSTRWSPPSARRTAVTAPASRSFTAYSVRPEGCTARYEGSPTPSMTPAPVMRPVVSSYLATPIPLPPPSTEVYVPRYSGRTRRARDVGVTAACDRARGRGSWASPHPGSAAPAATPEKARRNRRRSVAPTLPMPGSLTTSGVRHPRTPSGAEAPPATLPTAGVGSWG